MSQALVTVAAPIAVSRIPDALVAIQSMGNPATTVVAKALEALFGDEGVHFTSLHAFEPTDPEAKTGHIVLELSADGSEEDALARLVQCIGPQLTQVFSFAADWKEGQLLAYLTARKLVLGVGWSGRTGLAFAGTPGMSVGRIQREANLAKVLAGLLETQGPGLSPLNRLKQIREFVRSDPKTQWALEAPTPLLTPPSWSPFSLVIDLGVSFAKTFLWPFGVLWGAIVLARIAYLTLTLQNAVPSMMLVWSVLVWALGALVVIGLALVGAALALYLDLRRKEETDGLEERAPKRSVLHQILERENHYAQNHMVSLTRRKSGFTRRVTSRLAFWLIGSLAELQFQPGHLGDIGTIHFARWVMLPNSKDFVFFSNYGGSWESYLEDFITKAHAGLTAVWSNTMGFPRTQNLFEGGATDGERFKRFARHSMSPTPFWFSAYRTLTTDNIRSNAAIRWGLAAAVTDNEATDWLELFGSATRPPSKLESDQIQSLVFGGLSFMPHGHVLTLRLSPDRASARAWLRENLPDVAFDDGRRLSAEAVISLALGPLALGKLGLPEGAIESFPAAYLDGMRGPGRARILGDDLNDPKDPWWWGGGEPADVAVLIYGSSAEAVAKLTAKVRDLTSQGGHSLEHEIPLETVETPTKEPFGFLDGVSQPVIRGTYKALRRPDSIHLVEPGEFILGYPDNRQNLPPGPLMDAHHDPDNRLPVRCDDTDGPGVNSATSPREIARNGSYLVIRQLEQDPAAFWDHCESEASKLSGRLSAPYLITKEFIGAKLIGRWPDGSSLTRNPYQSYTASPLTNPTQRPESLPAGRAAPIAAAPVIEAVSAAPGALPETSAHRPVVADNDFLLGAEDPQGLRCPYGAHIRRANPRDSLDPGSQDQLDISNRHRILRIGRRYTQQPGQKPGLLFMCLNGDLERQFEFVQQTWLGSETFQGLSGERDPLAGNKTACPNSFTVPSRDGPIRLAPLPRFVTPRGGGYFFLAGKALLQFLSTEPSS